MDIGKLFGVGWLQSKRIKSKIARVIRLSKSPQWTKAWLDPSLAGTVGFGNVDAEEKGKHDTEIDLWNLIVGNGGCVKAVGDGRSVFLDQISQGGHHGDAAVEDLCLAESLDTDEFAVLAESKGVKVSCKDEEKRIL